MRRTLAVTAVTAIVTLGLGACAGPSLTDADRARCEGVATLTAHTSTSQWNSSFVDLATADDHDLRDAGQSFASAVLTSVNEALPYQKRAVAVCTEKGFEAATMSS